jgi:hypothetical protein
VYINFFLEGKSKTPVYLSPIKGKHMDSLCKSVEKTIENTELLKQHNVQIALCSRLLNKANNWHKANNTPLMVQDLTRRRHNRSKTKPKGDAVFMRQSKG